MLKGIETSKVAQAAQAFYEANLKAQLEPEHTGKFLVIDVTNQDYEMDATSIDAFHRIMARHPIGERFLIRIGYRAAITVGFRGTYSVVEKERR